MSLFESLTNPLAIAVWSNVLSVVTFGLLVNLIIMLVLWLISLWKRDVSIVDIYWGSAFVVLTGAFAFSAAQIDEGMKPPLTLLMVLVGVWGLRLTWHLWRRNSKLPEDRRYTAMRVGREKYFGIWSLFAVFFFQGILSWWISLPLAFAQVLNSGEAEAGFYWNVATLIGLIVWVLGFAFESIGDRQLADFKKDPSNKGKVMDQGLWRYTRHPNYFGDACLWWGFWIISLGCSGDFWPMTALTILSPITMTFFLLNISGVAMLEKDIATRRPDYAAYIKRTSSFFPLPPA